MWGEILENKVLLLVNSGATHNFISAKLVENLRLPVEPTIPYYVKDGGGQRIKTSGVCKGLQMKMQNMLFKADFYVFALDGEDIVLGMEWLEDMGEMRTNFKDLTLRIKKDGIKYTLKGDHTLCKEKVGDNEIPTTIKEVLEEFEAVFQAEQGLPPKRRQDHAIVLKEGAVIPNIRAYRYPHSQKNEIEKLVADMLKTGIIRPSVSPYSSPIILVKKDGS
uniref:Transposon Ty3-I Gag-Pol polyprotein n=1 Tax=Cajanus cajan TaxID=3821 RepID=A0A151RXL5_CAJCA|nr:hypothetical protein KK1_031095 [Cajanus cajan]